MSDQTKVTLVEDHHTWLLLSDGSVVTWGSPLFKQYAAQQPQARTNAPSGPRKILRAEFDQMPHPQRHEVIKSGAQIVDNFEVKAAPAQRQPSAISRATFDAMSETERRAIVADINRGDAQLID